MTDTEKAMRLLQQWNGSHCKCSQCMEDYWEDIVGSGLLAAMIEKAQKYDDLCK